MKILQNWLLKVRRWALYKYVIKNLIRHYLFRFFGNKKYDGNKKVIIFTILIFHQRILKQAAALKRTGRYHLILLTRFYDFNLADDVFDEIYVFWNNKGLLNYINRFRRKYSVYIIHAYGSPSFTAKEIIRQITEVPVVFDLIDSQNVRVGNGPKRLIFEFDKKTYIDAENEKFCLKGAQGIVARGPEIHLCREWFDIKTPILDLLDCCLEEFFVKNRKGRLSQGNDKELHIAYAGAVAPMGFAVYKHIQLLDIAKIVCEQKIHFHIYPSQQVSYELPQYHRFARQNRYFHMHKSLPIDKLTEQITIFDYGFFPIFFEIHNSIVSKDRRETGIGNKFFTYLEAGLPIISSKELTYVSKLLDDYGIGLSVEYADLQNLGDILEKSDHEKLTANVIKTREKLCMASNIGKLENFYKEINEKFKVKS